MTREKKFEVELEKQIKLIGEYSRHFDTSKDQIWLIFSPTKPPKDGFFIFNRLAFTEVFQEVIEKYKLFDPRGYAKEFCGFARDIVQKEWMCIRKYDRYSSSIIIHHRGFILYHFSLDETLENSLHKITTSTEILIKEIIPILYNAMNYNDNIMIYAFWQAKNTQELKYHSKPGAKQIKINRNVQQSRNWGFDRKN